MRELILWAAVALSVPFVLRRPLLGVLIYLGATIVRPEMLFWGSQAGSFLFSIYYVLVFGACLWQGYLKDLGRALEREFLLMLWMIGAMYLSTLVGQFPVDHDIYFIIELAKVFGICALVYVLAQRVEELLLIEQVMLGCLTFLGLWGIQQQMLGNERLEGLGGNAWGDSNGIAAVYVLFLPVALSRVYVAGNRRNRLICLAVLAVMVALVICTKSRGGLLGLLVSFLCFGIFSRNALKVLKIVLLLGVLVLPFASDSFMDRMKTMEVNDSENMESSARSRLILWQAGLMIFAEHPILGTGFMTYPEAKMKFEDQFSYLEDGFRASVFRTSNKKVTHNTYIQMLSDCGLFGAVPFMLLVVLTIAKGWWARKRLKVPRLDTDALYLLSGLCSGVAGFAVCIFTIDSVLSSFLYLQIVIIGILTRAIASTELEPDPDESPQELECPTEA